MLFNLKTGGKYKSFLNKNKKRFVTERFFMFPFDRSGQPPITYPKNRQVFLEKENKLL
jgi:hypothetical protein